MDEQELREDIELHNVTNIQSNIVANDNNDGVHLRTVTTIMKVNDTVKLRNFCWCKLSRWALTYLSQNNFLCFLQNHESLA